MAARELLGTWHLVSLQAHDSTGAVQYPWGEAVLGQLIYDGAGNFSAHVMRKDRPPFASGDSARGTDTELRAAFEGHASYFGTYSLEPSTHEVVHHVQGASFPNWIAGDQHRRYQFEGDRLVLSTPPMVVGGRSLELVVTWQRAR